MTQSGTQLEYNGQTGAHFEEQKGQTEPQTSQNSWFLQVQIIHICVTKDTAYLYTGFIVSSHMMITGMTSKSRAILNRKYASILLLTQHKDQLQPPQLYEAPEELLEQDKVDRTESKQQDDQWVMDDKHSHKDGWQPYGNHIRTQTRQQNLKKTAFFVQQGNALPRVVPEKRQRKTEMVEILPP